MKNIIENKFNSYEYKTEKAKQACNYIKGHMNSKDDHKEFWQKFLSHTDFLDLKRNQKFTQACSYYGEING